MSENLKTIPASAYQQAANDLRVELAAVQAVAAVESNGSGFLSSGTATILYEPHVFHRRTQGRFAGAKDRRGVLLSSPSWDRSLYGQGGEPQWNRLEDAAALDSAAAHESCSWGRFQIMGFHWRMLGYGTLEDFLAATQTGAGHLDMFVRFIKMSNLGPALRERNWREFARRYNGPGFEQNQYDTKLADAYAKFLRVGNV